ncbi:MAG TPA: hypothetical protein VGO47_01380, partial [Chlamydiales bacterium]|nr:hypothetical protein [Chlamydiales bacterium]
MPPPARTRSPNSLQAMEVAQEGSRLQSRMDQRRIRQPPPMSSPSVTVSSNKVHTPRYKLKVFQPGPTVIPEVQAPTDPTPFQPNRHEDHHHSDLEMADGT